MMPMISGSLVFNAAVTSNKHYYKLTFDWDNELGYDWEHLCASLFEHVEYSLYCKEPVRVLLLANTFEEDGQVVMVVKLLNLYFPIDSVLWSVLNSNWKISSVVETSKLARRNLSFI